MIVYCTDIAYTLLLLYHPPCRLLTSKFYLAPSLFLVLPYFLSTYPPLLYCCSIFPFIHVPHGSRPRRTLVASYILFTPQEITPFKCVQLKCHPAFVRHTPPIISPLSSSIVFHCPTNTTPKPSPHSNLHPTLPFHSNRPNIWLLYLFIRPPNAYFHLPASQQTWYSIFIGWPTTVVSRLFTDIVAPDTNCHVLTVPLATSSTVLKQFVISTSITIIVSGDLFSGPTHTLPFVTSINSVKPIVSNFSVDALTVQRITTSSARSKRLQGMLSIVYISTTISNAR